MTIDRPQVGGGQIPVAPGTCEACVWGRGPHTPGCVKVKYVGGMDLAGLSVETWPSAPPHTLFVISPRKCEEIIGPDGKITRIWEAEDQWGKRCAVIENIKVVE